MIVVVVIAVAAAAAGNAIGALRIADSLFRCFLQILLQILENLLHCIRWRWQFLIVNVVVVVIVIAVAIGAVQGKFMSRNGIALRQLLLNWICGIDNGLGMCAGYKFHRRSDGITRRRRLQRLYCLQ